MTTLSDSEILARCAKRMGIHDERVDIPGAKSAFFDPLRDDAQLMAMVKRWKLSLRAYDVDDSREWCVSVPDPTNTAAYFFHSYNTDLNRAICELCAKLPPLE